MRGVRPVLSEHRIEDEWRTFEDTEQRAFLIEWCRENNVDYEDDLHIGPPEHETSDREHLLNGAGWFVEQASNWTM